MTAATWLAALILGTGSVTVFVLFLRDLRRVLPPADPGGGGLAQRVEEAVPAGQEVPGGVDRGGDHGRAAEDAVAVDRAEEA